MSPFEIALEGENKTGDSRGGVIEDWRVGHSRWRIVNIEVRNRHEPIHNLGFYRFPGVRLTKTHWDTIQTVSDTQSHRFGCAVERSEFWCLRSLLRRSGRLERMVRCSNRGCLIARGY